MFFFSLNKFGTTVLKCNNFLFFCSPIISTPTQARPRRVSVASARGTAPAGNASTMDDFEDLLDEFTDDRLEDEIELDPGKGEDDLLLELSEMIDS